MTTSSQIPSIEPTIAVQAAITEFNSSLIKLILTAARTKDPVAALLLGIDQATLDEYVAVNSYDLIQASKIGAPLARPIFSDPASVRAAFKNGCSSALVLQHLSRGLPVLSYLAPNQSKRSES